MQSHLVQGSAMHRILFSHKKKEVPFVTTWTDPESIILINQRVDKYNMTSLICGT